jgi:prepilin-type N-terminal cleavage/methylation domain-containing protein
MKHPRGFTLIEMVVVLAVIAILAAILTPIVTSYVERARIDTATSDVKKIAAAIIQFNTDTRVWPIYSTQPFAAITDTAYDIEGSAGNGAIVPSAGVPGSDWPATAGVVGGANAGDLDAVLNQNRMQLALTGPRAWKGPYVELHEDPWGSKYYLTSKFLKPGITSNHWNSLATATASAVYVISPGPNQTVDTYFDQAATAFVVGNDDIVARIK